MECTRKVCNSPATHYNLSTRKYYCPSCAGLINFWSQKDWNKTLCYQVATCCVIRKADRPDLILLVSRKDDPTKFGLPGGKMEPGETPAQAICREVLEETGLTIDLGPLVHEDVCERHAPSGQDFYSYAYLANSYSGELSTNESGVLMWGTWEHQETGSFVQFNKGVQRSLAVNHPATRAELEWAGSSPLSRREGVGMCLYCGNLQNKGHDPECDFLDPNKTFEEIMEEIRCST